MGDLEKIFVGNLERMFTSKDEMCHVCMY